MPIFPAWGITGISVTVFPAAFAVILPLFFIFLLLDFPFPRYFQSRRQCRWTPDDIRYGVPREFAAEDCRGHCRHRRSGNSSSTLRCSSYHSWIFVLVFMTLPWDFYDERVVSIGLVYQWRNVCCVWLRDNCRTLCNVRFG